MPIHHDLTDTIAAIATPVGRGGIGMVRLGGKEALTIADQIFVSKAKEYPSTFSSHTLHYGWIKDDKDILDEVLLSVMRAPKTYTREDVVEISCHGGSISIQAILKLILQHGARLAEPGEFTKRAFLNGRIDLTQAEAVLDIIESKTSAYLRLSSHQLKGDLSTILEDIRTDLMRIYVELEAIVNFPEDDIDAQGRKAIANQILQNASRVAELLESSAKGKLMREGVQIVLCGKPNVGKSSLLNVFLKTPRAIVSEIAGTTRDTIEEAAQIKDIPVQIVDTAGILIPRDTIEEEAVKRAHQHIGGADLVLLVLDLSTALEPKDQEIIQAIVNPKVLVVYNKTDLPQQLNDADVQSWLNHPPSVKISATQRTGLDALENIMAELLLKDSGGGSQNQNILLSNARHIDALEKAYEGLQKAATMIDALSLEFISEEIKQAVHILDRITGRDIDHDLLETIFSQFCIGK